MSDNYEKLFDNLRSLNIDFKEYKVVIDTKYVEIPIWDSPYYNGYPRRDCTVPQISPQAYPIIVSQVSF